jgi:hypothetical protein
VLLIQDDHVVQQVSSATPDPALRDTVLPRTSKGGADRFCALLLNRSDDVCRELRVAVKDQKPVWPIVSPNFVQLQYDPQLGGLTSHIAVQNLPPIVADNEEAVQDSEGQRWHRKDRARKNLEEEEPKMRRRNLLMKSSGCKSRPVNAEQAGRKRVLPFTG